MKRLAIVVLILSGALPAAAQKPAGADIAITAPTNGATLATPVTDVATAFSSGKGNGKRIDFIELRANAQAVASFDVPDGVTAGAHTFPAVDLSPFAGTGQPITLVARAFVGKKDKKFVDSPAVQVHLTATPGDPTAPVIANLSPANNTSTGNRRPNFAAQVTDTGGSGVDVASIVLKVDGAPVLPAINLVNANTANVGFTPGADLADGAHSFTVDAKDLAGNAATTASSSFTVDATPPVITITAPASGAILNNRRPTISASITDAGGSGLEASGITLILNAVQVPAQVTIGAGSATLTFTPASDLADGTHAFTVQARDRALNAAPSVGRLFTIDSVSPGVAILAPDSTPKTTTSLPLNATVSDVFTGISSFQVTLNGAPQTVVATPGPLTPFGAPGSVALAGTLTAQSGANLLVVSAVDLAGNGGSATVVFDVSGTPPPPPITSIVLTIVSGDGQQGLVGRGADQPLVVRASDVTTGAPVPGLPLVFTGGGNTGTFARVAGATSTLTDGGGVASVRYCFSTRPGANAVRVYVSGLPDTAPVQFQLTGQLPSLIPGEPPSPCNFGVSTADFPGSALAQLLTVQAFKPDGSPLAGELVRPFVSKFQGQPPQVKVGRFLPSKTLTDQNGEARFAFVVDDGAPPGDFTMQFGLPEFRAADDTEVHFDVGGRVRNPNTEFRGDPVIDSGQGQIGALGKDTARPLKAKTDRHGGFIVFKVIEGNGVFTPTPNSDVRDTNLTPCGKPIWLLAADNDGFAELNFRRTSDVALIEISQGSDVFAVGPTEVAFTSTGLAEIPNLFPVDVDQASSPTAFKVLTRVPKGETPTGELKSINSLGEETAAIPDAVAPTSLDSGALAFTLVNSTAEYDVYASRDLIDTSQLQLPGETVTPGGGFAFVETTDFGGAVAEVTVQGEKKKFTVRNSQFVKATKDDLRPLIFNKLSPIVGGTPQKIKVSFKLGDKEVLDKVQWNTGAINKENKNSEFFMTFAEADAANHEGTEADPIVVGVPEDKNNTRRNQPVRADITFRDKDGGVSTFTLNTVVRIAMTERRTDDMVNPAPATQAGLTAIANWGPGPGANPPSGTNRVFTFATAAGVPGVPAALDANRLSFAATLPEANALSFRDDKTFAIYGTQMSGGLWIYDKGVVELVIGHETRHLKNAFDAQTFNGQTINNPYKALSQKLQTFIQLPETLNGFLTAFEHARFELDDLLDPRYSYRFHNDRNLGQTIDGGPGGEVIFIQAFNGTEQALFEKKDYTFVGTGTGFGVRGLAGVDVGAGLKTVLDTQLNNDYKRAVKAFPELQSKSEFAESSQLIKPPQ